MEQSPYQPPSSAEQESQTTDKTAAKKETLTPMMVQFFEIKAVNPGYLLFYRMGDFYELFFEDAEIASQALGIVLTKRGKHQGNDIAMCGVPVHAAQEYLRKLIALGHRVAICEQMEAPAEAKKRGAKSVVKRDVVRLVTRGTLTEDNLLPAKNNNYLASLASVRHGDIDFALAWADISTGETWVVDLPAQNLADELGRIDPSELIVTQSTLDLATDHSTKSGVSLGEDAHLTVLSADMFDSESAETRLRDAFEGVDATAYTRAGRAALGGLVAYVAAAQKTGPVALRAPVLDRPDGNMAIDVATRNSLEILQTNRGETHGSLRHCVDMTVTSAGGRLFARWLSAPLSDASKVNTRLDMVGFAVDNLVLTSQLRKTLRAVPDITRALTRLTLDRGGPRDLASLGLAIEGAHAVGALLKQQADMPVGLLGIATGLSQSDIAFAGELKRAINDEPPLLARDGKFVREGYDRELDHERSLATQSRTVIAALQAELAELTEIKSLKIKHNNVLGFFVEVPAAHGSRLMEEQFSAKFIHRQTMANAMRFTTAELAELEGKIARAHDAALTIESAIFVRLRETALKATHSLQTVADALASLDVVTALGTLASERNYCRPKVDESYAFDLVGARHPVVEQTLASEGASFVTNDCHLSSDEGDVGALWLITGPNMGGKSTFLRQNALIAIMAQMGGFVPATSAHIGIVDRVFSRVGASDDIAHGRSTFMVEMVETSAILNRATGRSLVILDEIGRGTSTFDGLSIAWASVEALHNANGCRALFATHFHELTRLAKTLSRVSNHTMKVREWQGDVVFLHEVADGAADRSYGIQVAKLAGLPKPVVDRARQVLNLLEQQATNSGGTASTTILDELPLFSRTVPVVEENLETKYEHKLCNIVDNIHPDELTPRQAIDLIYELKKARNADRPD